MEAVFADRCTAHSRRRGGRTCRPWGGIVLMEGGVEDGDHFGNALRRRPSGRPAAPGRRRGCGAGREGGKPFNLVDDLVGDEDRLAEDRAALDDPVADSGDFGDGIDDFAIALGQHLDDLLKGLGVGREGAVFGSGIAGGGLVGDAAVDADPFTVAFGHDLFGVHVHQLIFQRGAARVDNQDFHMLLPFLSICRPSRKIPGQNAQKRSLLLTLGAYKYILVYIASNFKLFPGFCGY